MQYNSGKEVKNNLTNTWQYRLKNDIAPIDKKHRITELLEIKNSIDPKKLKIT